MNNKVNIILIILIIIGIIASITVLIYKNTYKLNINLTNDVVKVNLFDEIDVSKYLISANDNKGLDLTDKVKIKISCGNLDVVSDNNILIKSNGDKIITYTVKSKGKKYSKSITLKVITDPFDEDYSPNYDYDNGYINEDDIPSDPGDTNLTEEEQEYINSFINK